MPTIVALGVVWVAGYLLARAILHGVWRAQPVTLKLGMGWVVGAGYVGMATFWSCALAGPSRVWGVFAALGIVPLAGLVRTRPIERVEDRPAGRLNQALSMVGAVLFCLTLAVWLAHGFDMGVHASIGSWDAWSIWTHHARYLFLAPDDWTRGFDPDIAWSHPDYPSLLPALVTYTWLPSGKCVTAGPVGLALLTHVAMLLLIVGFAQAVYPRSPWPWFLGIFYATLPQEWTQEGAWQYADRPLAAFLLAGAGSLAMAIREGKRAWLWPAGFALGAAAFTKDEGLAAVAILAVGVAFALTYAAALGRFRFAAIGVGMLTIVLLPGLASLALQRLNNPVPSRLISHMTLTPLTDTTRTRVIIEDLQNRLTSPQAGHVWLLVTCCLATLLPWLRGRGHVVLWLLPFAQLLVYLMIFQLTPEDLRWHLNSAFSRLLLHVGPTFYLAAVWALLEALEWFDGPGPEVTVSAPE